MLGRTYERENCSAARTLELVGERWSLLIVRNAAFAGMERFSDFERRLGIAPNILAKRLTDLVAHGLMVVEGDDGGTARRYRLTPRGRELGEIVVALSAWGDRWAAPDGPPIVYEHDECGGAVTVSTVCSRCEQHPAVEDVLATPGPGATTEQRAALDARLGR